MKSCGRVAIQSVDISAIVEEKFGRLDVIIPGSHVQNCVTLQIFFPNKFLSVSTNVSVAGLVTKNLK